MSSCVLRFCGLSMVKSTDKNLVDGRRGNNFKVREEWLSLQCKVEIDSTHICRNCLSVLSKQRALLTNLHEVNSNIEKIVHAKKSPTVPLQFKGIPMPSSNSLATLKNKLQSVLRWTIRAHL